MKSPILFLCGLAFTASGLSAQTLYFQSFDNTTDQAPITNLTNWNWAVSDGLGSNTTNRQFGRLSALAGVGGDLGFAYAFNNEGGVARASVAYYNGASFSQTQVTGFSAFVGNTNDTNQVRFLLQIDNANWFISTAAGQVSVGGAAAFSGGAQEFSVSFSSAGSNWVALDYDGLAGPASTGFSVFSGDISGSALSDPLPSGNITAVGAYLLNANNTATRFDNFTVIPEPKTYAAIFSLAALAVVIYRRRR